jgi:mannosyl-3-phosphoglycerate phosphatase
LLEGDGKLLKELEIEARKMGLKLQKGGIFYHLSGSHTKADALEELFHVLGNPFLKAKKIGLGDSPNDLEMLQWVDVPVVIAKPGGGYDKILIENLEDPLLPEGTGPAGWSKAIFEILREEGG